MTLRDEQLSALLDDALSDQQLEEFMQDLKRDPIADGEAAQRYRLMGDVMRDELDQSSFIDVSSALHRAIEKEPTYDGLIQGEKISKQGNAGKLASLFAGWSRPLGGMAVAASVAMVTLLTFNSLQNTPSSQSQQLAQSQQQIQAPAQMLNSPGLQAVVPVNPEIARNVQVASTLDIKKSVEQQRHLNNYMMQHSGYASQSTLQGMMPYVRAADVKKQEQN